MTKKEDQPQLPEAKHHQGSVSAEDEGLSLWLNKLWARNEPPERLEVWQLFGKSKTARGEMIFHEDFRHGEKKDIEQANKLANEIIEAAQNDTDASRRESNYQIAVLDKNRRASPLIRRLGPLQPVRTYKKDEDTLDEDGDLDGKALSLRYIREGIEQTRWVMSRNDRIVEGMMLLQNNIIQTQQVAMDRFMTQILSNFEKLQDSLDRSQDRELVREREKMKITLMKDGLRTVRNLIPGLLNEAQTPTAPQIEGAPSQPQLKPNVMSPERTLVDNFLHDCEEANIDIALFGDFEEKEGRIVQVKPGIFTLKQFSTLVGVREGRFPPSVLDDLMPQSGHENEITPEQVQKARDAGVTDGIAVALIELIGLRQRVKEQHLPQPSNNQATQPQQ